MTIDQILTIPTNSDIIYIEKIYFSDTSGGRDAPAGSMGSRRLTLFE